MLSLFGVAGGVGVSTLVALTRESIRDRQGRPLQVSAADPEQLRPVLAAGNIVEQRHADLHDGGKFQREAVVSASRLGKIALVVPRTPLGAAQAVAALQQLQNAGIPQDRMLGIVNTSMFGGRSRSVIANDLPHFWLNYEPVFEQGGPVAMNRIGKDFERSLGQWLQAVRSA